MMEIESAGSSVSEVQSFEFVVEGLKMGIDGAKHLAVIIGDMRWQRVALALDMVLRAIVARAGSEYVEEPNMDLPVASGMTVSEAFLRHMDGLRKCSGALRQMGVYHRQQEFWLDWAKEIEEMQDKAAILLRRNANAFLVVPGTG